MQSENEFMNQTNDVNWEAVYWTQMPRIYNFFRYRLGNNQLAQDLTATTFEKAWRSREQYRRDRGAFETWLFSIARNTANDHFRSHQPHELSLDEAHTVASNFSVEDESWRRQLFAQLYQLLEKLPRREKELIALKYGSGLTNRDIAVLTQLSESNVGTLLHRIIQKLRKEWESTYEPTI